MKYFKGVLLFIVSVIAITDRFTIQDMEEEKQHHRAQVSRQIEEILITNGEGKITASELRYILHKMNNE